MLLLETPKYVHQYVITEGIKLNFVSLDGQLILQLKLKKCLDVPLGLSIPNDDQRTTAAYNS